MFGSVHPRGFLKPRSCPLEGLRQSHFLPAGLILLAALTLLAGEGFAQAAPPTQNPPNLQTTDDWNRRLRELTATSSTPSAHPEEYRLGPQDLLEIQVFEAPELNRTVRISASGEIYLPLLEGVRAAGLTPRELEFVLQELLRRKYMKDPHVSVFVKEMESHNVSVFGAVKRPGVFPIRGSKSVIEMLSLAEGLEPDAGDSVIIIRGGTRGSVARAGADRAESLPAEDAGAAAGEGIEINLKALLESGDASLNVNVYPGDTVKVPRAGIVYVVGEVKRPGGFVLRSNENVSVLQALAMAEGLTRTARASHCRIIRTDPKTGQRLEIPVDLGRVMASKAPDAMLQARDILFVPSSTGKAALFRGTEAAISVLTGVLIYRGR
jgi:polysaccharide export outer membrane protein